MPFDANLVLCDGSADWTFANINTATYGQPTSLTRNAGGFVVLDLLALGGTPAKGISIVLILDDTAAGDADELTLIIESSNNVAFGSVVHQLAPFDLAAATSGVILGTECPCTVIRRIHTTDRYIRANASVTAADDFKTGYIFVSPHAFNRL